MTRQNPEFRIQAAIVQMVRFLADPQIIWYHVPNGNKLAPRTAAHNKSLGVLAGVSDLVFDKGGRNHYLEVKAPNGRLSPEQKLFRDTCLETQRPYEVVYSVDEAREVLKRWGILRGFNFGV